MWAFEIALIFIQYFHRYLINMNQKIDSYNNVLIKRVFFFFGTKQMKINFTFKWYIWNLLWKWIWSKDAGSRLFELQFYTRSESCFLKKDYSGWNNHTIVRRIEFSQQLLQASLPWFCHGMDSICATRKFLSFSSILASKSTRMCMKKISWSYDVQGYFKVSQFGRSEAMVDSKMEANDSGPARPIAENICVSASNQKENTLRKSDFFFISLIHFC